MLQEAKVMDNEKILEEFIEIFQSACAFTIRSMFCQFGLTYSTFIKNIEYRETYSNTFIPFFSQTFVLQIKKHVSPTYYYCFFCKGNFKPCIFSLDKLN